MKYQDGQTVLIGDRVRLGTDDGVVVFSIDTGEYDDLFPKTEWEYLESGIMVNLPNLGLVHIAECDPNLLLLERA
jgi:hypothetical protein